MFAIDHIEIELAALRAQLTAAQEELAKLRKGEFICKRCGLRKDAEHDAKPDF